MNIHNIVLNVKNEKENKLYLEHKDTENVNRQIQQDILSNDLAIIHENQLSKWFNQEQNLDFNKRMNEMTIRVNKQEPLLNQEKILSDTHAILRHNYNDFEAGTPVLIRETNKAVKCYIDGGKLDFFQNKEEISWKDFLKNMGETVGGFLLDNIASSAIGALIDLIFGNSQPFDFKQMLEDMKKIVHTEIQDSILNQVGADIQTVIRRLKVDYTPVNSNHTISYLQQNALNPLEKSIQQLKSNSYGYDYRIVGLPLFTIAQSTLLSVYEEMTKLDNPSSPTSSSYYNSLIMSAKDECKYMYYMYFRAIYAKETSGDCSYSMESNCWIRDTMIEWAKITKIKNYIIDPRTIDGAFYIKNNNFSDTYMDDYGKTNGVSSFYNVDIAPSSFEFTLHDRNDGTYNIVNDINGNMTYYKQGNCFGQYSRYYMEYPDQDWAIQPYNLNYADGFLLKNQDPSIADWDHLSSNPIQDAYVLRPFNILAQLLAPGSFFFMQFQYLRYD